MPTPRKTLSFTPAALLAALAGTALGQSAEPFPAQFQLSSLLPANGGDGSIGFVLNGIDGGDRSGISVSCAGDVNGDGIDDLIIGATYADPNGNFSAGESYVVFGAVGVGAGGVINLSSLNGANGFVINGIDQSDYSGISVSSAGDVNGDGIDDLIIGTKYIDPKGYSGVGESYVVFGAAGVGSGGSINLSSLNGANGFVLNGIDVGDSSGGSVSSAGDVNGDGIDDLIIGANRAYPNGSSSGESYVVFGAAGLGAGGVIELSSLNGSNGFVLNGIDVGDSSGGSVSSAGDVNGDGIDDLIIGAQSADPNGNLSAGESYVVFGGLGVGSGGAIELSSLNGTDGFVLNGIVGNDSSGFSVSSAGDVNGDGIDDLIIGANRADPNANDRAGESYVVFGAAGLGSGGVIELSSLNGANGFVLNGIDAFDRSGRSVSSAGDVNGDGIGDLIIGAYSANPNGNYSAGESYVVFGIVGLGSGGVINLSSLNGGNGFVLNGIDRSDNSGFSVSSAGDVNGDGIDDLVIGAWGASPNGNSTAGESYVVFGRVIGNVWTSPASGSFDTGSNWRSGRVPIADIVTIDTPIGVTVTGPAGALFIEELLLGAALGQTILDLQADSLVSIANPFTLPASAALTGAGTFVSESLFTNNGLIEPSALTIVAPIGLTNNADINMETFGPVTSPSELQVFGTLTNEVGGDIFARGSTRLETSSGLINQGNTDISFAQCTVAGPITNEGISDGIGGFTPLGLISISGASEVVFTDDVLNQSDIVLTTDSSLVILGLLTGNGVAGPGGGPGGTVFLKGGFDPGFALATVVATFGGDVNLGIANTTTIDIGGTTAGTDHDQIATLANLGAGGTLEVLLLDGFTPSPGDEYQVFDFATVSGSFSSIILDQALINAGADTSNLLTTGTIIIPAFCFGDANGDGFVNFVDITSVLGNWLTDGSTGGDANDDGVVNFGDITSVLSNWLGVCP